MKKSRAIELLKLAVPIKALTQQEYADFVEAVNIGMDALEQPTSPDTIDRKAALDALRRCQTYLYDARDPELKIELSSAEEAIKELPTIQPQSTTGQPNDGVRSTARSTDLIDRQQTLDALIGAVKKVGILDADDIKAVFDMLPTIQPEERTEKRTEMHGVCLDEISRQAVIEAVEKNACNTQRIMDAVNNLPPAQPEPQWIPVSERVPYIDMSYPHSEHYLVQYDSGGMDVASWSNVNRFWTDHVTKPYWNCVQFAKVIAWMPLPEPYEERRER